MINDNFWLIEVNIITYLFSLLIVISRDLIDSILIKGFITELTMSFDEAISYLLIDINVIYHHKASIN